MEFLKRDYDGFLDANWDRDEALILVDDKWYSSFDHQSAMMEYIEDYWSSRGLNLDNDHDFAKAIEHTDSLFKSGIIYGLDLMCDNKGNQYLVSHYKNIINNPDAMKCVKQYMREHPVIFGYYTNEEKLGDKCDLLKLDVWHKERSIA